jgi:hypothetical protein
MKNITLLLLIALQTYNSYSQTTITLTPQQDVAIGYHTGANTANNNFVNAQQCAAFAIPSVASTGGLNVNKGLMLFNLTLIPAGSTITNAQLDLYAYDGPIGVFNGHMGPNNDAYLERVTSNWNENIVTWNSQPTTTPLNRVYLNGTTNPILDYLNINVTTLIQDVYSSTTNYGIELKMVAETATNILAFCSKNYPNALKHPKLKITYIGAAGVEDMKKAISNITCFPNPATDILNFSVTSTISGFGKISIYDNQGKHISESKIELNNGINDNVYTINTTSLNKGSYFFSLLVNDEQKSGKFIITN